MPKIGLERIVERRRVHDVVGADDDRDIGLGELVVDLLHLDHDVVGHARLGEQHVHVAGQPSGHRVNREPDIDPPFAQELGDLEDADTAPARPPCRSRGR